MENQPVPTSKPIGYPVRVLRPSPDTIAALRRCRAMSLSILIEDDTGVHEVRFRALDGNKIFHITMKGEDFDLFLDPDSGQWFVIRTDTPAYSRLEKLIGHSGLTMKHVRRHGHRYAETVAALNAQIKRKLDDRDDSTDDQTWTSHLH